MPDPRSLSSILRTLAVDERAQAAQRRPPDGQSAAVQLAFLGNWHDPCPRLLLLDPKLEPVDIVTWQVIRVHAEPGRLVAFPTYRDLMHWVRVSRATVARAVTVLRLARWLPLCASVRDSQGRFQGNVYALHDEPLPLADTLRVDEHYVRFAEQARAHRHAHVRNVADETWNAIREAAVSETKDLTSTALSEHITLRFKRMTSLFDRAARGASDHPNVAHQVQNLNSVTSDGARRRRVQDLNSAHRVQNLNSAVRSSKSETTTTCIQTTSTSNERTNQRTHALRLPPEIALTDSQRRVLALRLDAVPVTMRQDVLDEASGRILAKRHTNDPVRSEFDYIAELAARAIAGEFVLTDVGQGLRETRHGRATADTRLARARAHSELQRRKEVAAFEARQLKGKQS